MELTPATSGILLIATLVLGVVALGVAFAALQGQRRVRNAYRVFSRGSRPGVADDVLVVLEEYLEEVASLRRDVGDLRGYADTLRDLIRGGLSLVGTVRYDAFEDMGGQMSFSAALLDEHGDGLVLTAINSRTDARTYIKPVHAGQSRQHLSEEEREAISRATGPGGRRPASRRALAS